jgi:hypothetical protein
MRPSPVSTGSAPTVSTSNGIATGEWFRLHNGPTLVKAIEMLGSEGLLHPA